MELNGHKITESIRKDLKSFFEDVSIMFKNKHKISNLNEFILLMNRKPSDISYLLCSKQKTTKNLNEVLLLFDFSEVRTANFSFQNCENLPLMEFPNLTQGIGMFKNSKFRSFPKMKFPNLVDGMFMFEKSNVNFSELISFPKLKFADGMFKDAIIFNGLNLFFERIEYGSEMFFNCWFDQIDPFQFLNMIECRHIFSSTRKLPKTFVEEMKEKYKNSFSE